MVWQPHTKFELDSLGGLDDEVRLMAVLQMHTMSYLRSYPRLIQLHVPLSTRSKLGLTRGNTRVPMTGDGFYQIVYRC